MSSFLSNFGRQFLSLHNDLDSIIINQNYQKLNWKYHVYKLTHEKYHSGKKKKNTILNQYDKLC